MTVNKHHWYDGWFYDKFIAPNQDMLFGQIKNLIEPGCTVLDIGCGTGRLAFAISDKSKSVLGIDLSERNIRRALLTSTQKPNSRISFKHANLNGILNTGDLFFDYAIFTYVIHEVNESDRLNLLIEAARVSRKIIIGDYFYPRPTGLRGWLSEIIEFMAGRDHYRNYKSYMQNGGIHGLVRETGLKITSEITNQPSVNHIVVLHK
jgi:SAM-dependent methyltransferase